MVPIVYQDEHLILVEKPVGLLSQEDAAGGDSLPRQLAETGFPVKPVHRLDRFTGGIMVYARSGQAAAGLSETVRHHDEFVKDYLAVILGKPETSQGTLEDLLYHDRIKNRSYVVKRPRNGVKKAVLDYTVVDTVETEHGTLSLLLVRLHTGRTHQIRVQWASRKMPLVGDTHYGSGIPANAPALWSFRLSFPHPVFKTPQSAVSLPDTQTFPWNLFSDTIHSLS